MSAPPPTPHQAIENARQALRRGERREARRWAQIAIAEAPELEDSWLLLAAVSSPQASLEYLKRALEINPGSQRARQGMHWAIRRLRAEAPSPPRERRTILPPPGKARRARSAPYLPGLAILGAVLLAVCLLTTGLAAWLGYSQFGSILVHNVLAGSASTELSPAVGQATHPATQLAQGSSPTPTASVETAATTTMAAATAVMDAAFMSRRCRFSLMTLGLGPSANVSWAARSFNRRIVSSAR